MQPGFNCAVSDSYKMEQKPINFSIIKEKIIKTDEVLKLLKKSQHECKDWKNKYKQTVLALKRSQLESDRYLTNVELLKVKQQTLEEENKSLSEQNAYFEETYNKHSIDSMQTIKDLQDELQMMQELKGKESKVKKEHFPDTNVENFKLKNDKLTAQISELLKRNDIVAEENKNIINNLQSKNQEYIQEIEELKSQVRSSKATCKVDKNKLEKLEKQVCSLTITNEKYIPLKQENKNLVDKLTETEFELEQWKSVQNNRGMQEVSTQTDMKEENILVGDLNSKIEDPQLEGKCEQLQKEITTCSDELLKSKTKQPNLHHIYVQTDSQCHMQDTYFLENEKLSQKIKELEEIIKMLENQMCSSKANVCSQTESTDSAIDSDFETDTVSDILKEMLVIPRMLSPFSSNENSMDTVVITPPKIPSIVITPSTPTEKLLPQIPYSRDNLLHEVSYPISEKPATKETSKHNITATIEEKKFPLMKSIKMPKKKICFSYNDFIKQQSWHLRQKKFALKKRLSQRRKKFAVAKDGFLDSLKALKRSNINFMISNEPAVQRYSSFYSDFYNQPVANHNYNSSNTQIDNITLSSPQNIENLNCCSKNCKQKYMLVNKSSEGIKFLGFFSIKAEAVTPTAFHTGHAFYNKPIDHTNDVSKNDITSDTIINQIATIVCEKLKSDGISVKKAKLQRSNSVSERSDSFCSETETEIERLFRKTPTDILKQNKMLWEEARHQNRGQLSTDDSCQSRTDVTSEEFRSGKVIVAERHSSGPSKNFASFLPSAMVDSNDNGKPDAVSHMAVTDSFNSFKVPSCPKLLSPIHSNTSVDSEKSPSYFSSPLVSLCSTLGSPLNSPPMESSSSVKNLSFTTNQDTTINSNVSFHINKILEDRQNLTQNLSRFLSSFSEENFGCHKSPNSSNKVEQGQNINKSSQNKSYASIKSNQTTNIKNYIQTVTDVYDGSPKSPDIVENYSEAPIITIPLERREMSPAKVCTGQKFVGTNDPLQKIVIPKRTLRRSKRIIEKNAFPDIIKRKRLKSVPLESSESDDEHLESPGFCIKNVEGILKKECIQKDAEALNCDSLAVNCTESKTNLDKDVKKYPEKLNTLTDKKPCIAKKTVSKLKSRILQQMKIKKNMMDTRKTEMLGCDILSANDRIVGDKSVEMNSIFVNKADKVDVDSKHCETHQVNNVVVCKDLVKDKIRSSNSIETTNNSGANSIKRESDISLTRKNTNNSGKIRIVQNILIPPNSKSVVDLLKDSRKPVSPNRSGDILSEILINMDKDKPKKLEEVAPAVQRDAPVSIDDKQFRDNVLDIAEILHTRSQQNCKIDYMPIRDISVLESKILQKGRNLSWEIKALLSKFYKCLKNETIEDRVILKFKKLGVDVITDIILNQVARSFEEKPSLQYVNAPLLTDKQKLFLCLMLRLEKEAYPEMTNTFLNRTEQYLLYRGCNIRFSVPIVRLYMTICRLRGDITRVRKFLSDSFYLVDDAAVPICFTVLTNWVEVMPKWNNWQNFPLSKVLFQVIHLKECSKPGYNLFPLKCLLAQYYEFPKERWDCDELFEELYAEYLKDPSQEREIAIRLLCKNKQKPWLFQKINQFFKPLVYKIPSDNVNFKASIIILIGKLCQYFRPKYPAEEAYLTELRRWFLGLIEDGAPKLIIDSLFYVMDKLPKKKFDKRANAEKKNHN